MKRDRDVSSRRQFLKTSAAASVAALGVPYFVPARSLGAENAAAPSDRVVIGVIGCGGMGRGHLGALLDHPEVQVAAICDVDAAHREQALEIVHQKVAAAGKSAAGDFPAYGDFRRVLERPDIDAVYVATPDHWHALISIAAAKAGKDIYCEKPLANSIAEGRAICKAVNENKRILQCGSHERSNPNVRYACELVRSGKLGDVKTVRVHLPCDDPHHQEARSRQTAPAPAAVPEGFDYDFWLGPTEKVPYAENRCHFWWRFNHRYGGGEMTDRGAHIIDIAQLALDMDASGPVEYQAQGVPLQGGLYDVFLDFEFENVYPNGVRLIGEKTGPRGIKFEGSKGTLFVNIHGGKLEADPATLVTEQLDTNPFTGYSYHRQNFLDAVKSRKATHATAEIGHRTGTICHLNNLSMRLGRQVKWDPVAETVIGDDEANALLTPKMREPWQI